jgi:peptide deformylase
MRAKSLRLHTFPEDENVLRTKCREVTVADIDTIQKVAPEMYHLGRSLAAAAIAAPQVGLDLAFFVHCGLRSEVVINPRYRVLSYASSVVAPEGCLSFPDKVQDVARWNCIAVDYLTSRWTVVEKHLYDFEARVFQHEVDHLEGKLFID